MKKLLRIAMLLAITGALLGLALPGLAALSGVGHRWPDVMAQFAAPAFVLSLLFAVALILLKKNMSAVGAVGVAALSLLAVWPQWVTPMGAPDPAARPVRLYVANVYYLNDDVTAIRASIEEADPDIVMLLELGRDASKRMDQILAGYPHRVLTPPAYHNKDIARSVIASRLPLTEGPQSKSGVHTFSAVAETPWGPLNLVGVHLTRPWPFQFQWAQINQVTALGKVVKGLSGPTILAGDFNSVSSTRIGRQVQSDMGLTPAPGWPGTWPAAAPSALGVTIDQVWRTQDLAFVSRRLGAPTGSDHRPVVTEITRAAR